MVSMKKSHFKIYHQSQGRRVAQTCMYQRARIETFHRCPYQVCDVRYEAFEKSALETIFKRNKTLPGVKRVMSYYYF